MKNALNLGPAAGADSFDAAGRSYSPYQADTLDRALPSGWWLLPSAMAGSGIWVWVLVALFT